MPGENDGNIAFDRGIPNTPDTSGTYEFSFKNGFTTSKYCVKRPSEDRGLTDVKMTHVYLRSEAEAGEWAEELERNGITASNWGYANWTDTVSFVSSKLSGLPILQRNPKTTSAALIGAAIFDCDGFSDKIEAKNAPNSAAKKVVIQEITFIPEAKYRTSRGVPGVLKEVYYYSAGRSWVIVSKSETLKENLKELLDSGVIGDGIDSELIARNEEGYPTFKIRRHSINFE